MVRTDIPTIHILLVFPTREGENSATAGVLAGFDITLGIPHKPGVAGGINRLVDGLECLDNIANPGLAAMTPGAGLAGTIKNIINSRAHRSHPFKHMGRNPVKFVLGKNPFTNPRLIGNHKKMIPRVRQPFQGLQRPRQKMKPADFGNV